MTIPAIIETYQFNEDQTGQLVAPLLDESGVALPLSALQSLELWLYDVQTNAIINSRGTYGGAGQSVLNAHNVAVSSDGIITWKIQSADSVIVSAASVTEEHRAVFRAITTSGYPVITHQYRFMVLNLKPL